MPPQISVTVWSQRVCFIRTYMFITEILYSSLLFLFAYLTFILQITDVSPLQTGLPHHPVYSFAVHLLAVLTVNILLLFLCIWITYLSLLLTCKLYEVGWILCFYLSSPVCSKCSGNTRNELGYAITQRKWFLSVLSHVKTQLVKARNKSVSLGTFSFSIFLHVRLVCLANSKQG